MQHGVPAGVMYEVASQLAEYFRCEYKYEDYYSAYDIEKYNPISNLRIIDKNVIDFIKEEYVIKETKVDEIKQMLINNSCFRI